MKLITEAQAAKYIDLPEWMLKKFRCQGMIDVYGVQPSDVNNSEAKVWYDRDELDEYLGEDRGRPAEDINTVPKKKSS